MRTTECAIERIQTCLGRARALLDLVTYHDQSTPPSAESITTAMHLAGDALAEVDALIDAQWLDLRADVPIKD